MDWAITQKTDGKPCVWMQVKMKEGGVSEEKETKKKTKHSGLDEATEEKATKINEIRN